MTAGTVISGGFPGRVAREVNPNSKCSGCLHYDGQAGRTGSCTIGDSPWKCGEGDAPQIGYAPIARGAGGQLLDLCNHGAHAPEVPTQGTSSLYGAGSTRPVEIRQVSLGEEHVHIVKSVLARHAAVQKSQCRMCSMQGTHGVGPMNVGPQACTCSPIKAEVVAKAVVSGMSNAQRAGVRLEDVVGWVRGVVKSGFRLPAPSGGELSKSDATSIDDQVRIDGNGGHLRPMEKGSHYLTSGRYDVKPAGGGEHHVEFHSKDGAAPKRLPGKFASPKAARRAAIAHDGRLAVGSGKISTATEAPTRQIKTGEVQKSLYSDDWIAQFKGTPLFDEASKLCEQELSLEEDQLKRREARMARDKERSAALEKINAKVNSVAVDNDWQEQDVRREKMRIAKQRLTLKLAKLNQAPARR